MGDAPRARKLADRIKVVVAETLEKRIKDPRLGFVTITDVRVTNDLQHASIFYTSFGDAEAQTATAAALESAKGVIRSEVGKATQIRLTPSIDFFVDALPETAAHFAEILEVAKQRDAEVAALAMGAKFAGDADPYKKPVDEDDESDDDAASDVADGQALEA